MPRESFIVAVSGQPTKNLGATIINAGDTPAGDAGTNDATNNPAFGTLLGSNTGKSSGSKVVERAGIASSGVGGAIPGVQVASSKLEQQIASPTVGATTVKGLTTPANQIQKATVGWKNFFRQYPTTLSPSTKSHYGHHRDWHYSSRTDKGDKSFVSRAGNSLFGSSVQIGKRSGGGMIIAAAAPSGNARTKTGVGLTGNSNNPAGFVDSWEHNLKKLPSIPGEVGTIDDEGFPTSDTEVCKSVSWSQPYICPGTSNGFNRTDSRIMYTGQTDFESRAARDKRHTVTASGAGVGHCIAFNDDGSRMAVGMPFAQEEKGEVRIYEICTVGASGNYWHRIGSQISGNQKGDRFGWSVALDGVGNTVFAGAPKGAGGSGYVQLHELSGYGGSASWTQTAAACSSGVAAQDRYGYSVSCNKNGDIYAVGAPGGSGTRGYAQMFGYGAGKWITLRRNKLNTFRQSQQAAADNGKTKVQRIVGEASGERLGWSVDLMYNCELPGSLGAAAAGKYNIRVAVGSPYWSSSVEGYDFSKRTFAERAAGVPIFDGVSIFSGAGGGFNPVENGLEFETKGLTSEGRVTCWGYSGESMLNTKKYGYAFLEYIQFGKSSSKEIMKGNYLSELGYSVKLSDEGDFLVAGAPGTDTSLPDDSDCKVKADAGKGKDITLPVEPITPPPVIPGDPCQPGILAVPSFGGKNYNLGTGAVRVYKYLWKGSDGEDARREAVIDEEDYFIKYGATIKGVEFPDSWTKGQNSMQRNGNARYKRPNFQTFGQFDAIGDSPTYYEGERFGTSVAVLAEFTLGQETIPQVVVGAPYAKQEEYDRSTYSNKYNVLGTNTGRIDAYVAIPKLSSRAIPVRLGAGGAGFGGPMGRRTKPKFTYKADGTAVPASGANDGGGRESFFIAPNVSGSGLSDDNALKSSRKTFGTGGINFTSSD